MQHFGKNESKCKKEQYVGRENVGRKKIQKTSSFILFKKIALKDSVLLITNRIVTGNVWCIVAPGYKCRLHSIIRYINDVYRIHRSWI